MSQTNSLPFFKSSHSTSPPSRDSWEDSLNDDQSVRGFQDTHLPGPHDVEVSSTYNEKARTRRILSVKNPDRSYSSLPSQLPSQPDVSPTMPPSATNLNSDEPATRTYSPPSRANRQSNRQRTRSNVNGITRSSTGHRLVVAIDYGTTYSGSFSI